MARFFREDFDPSREFVVLRDYTYAGQRFLPGQEVYKSSYTPRRLRQLYDTRFIEFRSANAKPTPAPPLKPKVERYRPRRLVTA